MGYVMDDPEAISGQSYDSPSIAAREISLCTIPTSVVPSPGSLTTAPPLRWLTDTGRWQRRSTLRAVLRLPLHCDSD